jgi:hypothetical protein
MGSRIATQRPKAGLSQAQLAEAPEDSATHGFFLRMRGGRHSVGVGADGADVGYIGGLIVARDGEETRDRGADRQDASHV